MAHADPTICQYGQAHTCSKPSEFTVFTECEHGHVDWLSFCNEHTIVIRQRNRDAPDIGFSCSWCANGPECYTRSRGKDGKPNVRARYGHTHICRMKITKIKQFSFIELR